MDVALDQRFAVRAINDGGATRVLCDANAVWRKFDTGNAETLAKPNRPDGRFGAFRVENMDRRQWHVWVDIYVHLDFTFKNGTLCIKNPVYPWTDEE